MNRRLTVSIALALSVAAGSMNVQAWGNDGHQIVCAIAYKLLSAADQQEVDRLTHLYRTPDNGRYQFFTRACTFPDLARSQARSQDQQVATRWQHFAQFSDWHFLNLARTDRTVDAPDCGNNCVLHGIDHHLGQLGNHSLTDKQRAEALFFLGHWVGDVHQPLHISYKDDLGGNNIKPITGFYTPVDHLHGVWDSRIIGKAHGATDWWTFSGQLRARITPQLQQEWSAVPRVGWAQESYDIATQAEARYCRMSGAACQTITPNSRNLLAAYQTTFGSVVELRLEKAGARLAALIQQALH